MSKLAKLRRRHKKNPGGPPPRRNPPLGTDIVEYILPGFGAFAATRFLTRIAATQIAKRWPAYAKHAGALASVGTFGAAWFGVHRVKPLARYHHPIVVGAGLAALQSLIQIYVPMLGWMVADATPDLGTSPLVGGASPPILADIPEGFQETDADSWFSYNDAFDAGRYKAEAAAPRQQAPAAQAAQHQEDQQADDGDIDDLLDNSDMGLP